MQFQDQVKVPIHLIPRGSKDFLQLIHHSAARQYMVEMLSYPHFILLGAIAGLASHQIYKRYEPSVVRFLFNTCVLIAASVAVAYRVDADVVSALGSGIVFGGCYLLSLVLSIVVYRLYLHPLKKYPGPTLAKLTKWAGFYYSSTGHLHDIVPELHRQYGDVMRIGPNELSFSSPDAVRDIHGANSALLPKGPAYGTKLWADGSGMTNSPLPVHKLRRKAWEKGLNSKALVDYEPRIRPTESQLTIPHWPIIDWNPFPRFRDALIRNRELYDLTDVCAHLNFSFCLESQVPGQNSPFNGPSQSNPDGDAMDQPGDPFLAVSDFFNQGSPGDMFSGALLHDSSNGFPQRPHATTKVYFTVQEYVDYQRFQIDHPDQPLPRLDEEAAAAAQLLLAFRQRENAFKLHPDFFHRFPFLYNQDDLVKGQPRSIYLDEQG